MQRRNRPEKTEVANRRFRLAGSCEPGFAIFDMLKFRNHKSGNAAIDSEKLRDIFLLERKTSGWFPGYSPENKKTSKDAGGEKNI